jgi:hypothetical protein
LLAAGSLGIEKVQENRLFCPPGRFLGFGQIIQPTDIQGHANFSFQDRFMLSHCQKT